VIENINQQASFAYARPADQSNHSHCLISQYLAKTLPFAAAAHNLPAVVKLGLIRPKGSEEVIWVQPGLGWQLACQFTMPAGKICVDQAMLIPSIEAAEPLREIFLIPDFPVWMGSECIS
jgi:hypothetical protein